MLIDISLEVQQLNRADGLYGDFLPPGGKPADITFPIPNINVNK